MGNSRETRRYCGKERNGQATVDFRLPIVSLLALLIEACASYDGRGLVPGRSTAADVEGVMGRPSLRLRDAGGDRTWYYARGSQGLDTYAVRMAPDETVRSVEQVLTVENTRKIVFETSTAGDVLNILGPPWRKTKEGSPPKEIWQYRMYDDTRTECNYYVWFSDAKRVEKTLLIKDFSIEPGGRR